MKEITFLIISIFFLCGCISKEKENGMTCCSDVIPPPPPPEKNEIDLSEQIVGIYGNEKIEFNARLISDNLIHNGSEDIQLYKLIGANKFESDTFYITCPNKYKSHWGKLKFLPDRLRMSFYIGFDNEDQFRRIYRLRLGSVNKNKGRIFMDYVDEKGN